MAYELKRGGGVFKNVCDVLHSVLMSARQAIEAVMHEINSIDIGVFNSYELSCWCKKLSVLWLDT